MGSLVKKGIILAVLFVAANVFGEVNIVTDDISSLLQNKNADEKADIKSEKIQQQTFNKKEIRSRYDIEIVSIKKIAKGIEIYARAWENGKQIGFGKDGTVDIERFVFINPPILVEDPNGSITREYPTDNNGNILTKHFREDPKEAILQAIESTLDVKKEKDFSNKIQKGKIGRTTLTVYPDSDPESVTVDGYVARWQSPCPAFTWADVHDNTGTTVTDSNTIIVAQTDACATNWRGLFRSIILFDTSSIPDSATISSATWSGYVTTKDASPDEAMVIAGSAPASNTSLVAGDYLYSSTNFGTAAYSATKMASAFTLNAYNDFSLNSNGIAAISKTGVTKLAFLLEKDRTNVEPTHPGREETATDIRMSSADVVGTTQDPKLVVEYSSAAAEEGFTSIMIIGN